MPTGKPFPFNEELFQQILNEIEVSTCGIKKILSEKEEYPCVAVWNKWLNEDQERVNRYARAKELQADNLFDEILDIADSPNADIVGEDEETGKPIIDGQIVQRARLMIDTRKWMMGKLKPKKYGDKLDVTSDGKAIEGTHVIITKEEAKNISEQLENDL